jgi:uncharacterized membrane-anchored protein
MRSVVLTALLCLPTALAAQGSEPEFDRARFEAQLRYQQGVISLRRGLATLNVPPSFRYLDAKQAERVLVEAWGNPMGRGTLGMLVPSELSPLAEDGWAIVITYADEGHVKDDDAEGIDYGKLLRDMQKSARADNRARIRAGYPPVELIGWAAPPRYDRATRKLYWAKELKFGDEANTLNYNIRVLGRSGVLVLNAVASMDQLPEVERRMADVLTFVDFNAGHRYADFNPATDNVAQYGIAALVAGGIAAKTGVFKGLLAALLAAKKLVAALVIALFAGIAKLFKKQERPAPAPATSRPRVIASR